MKRYDLRHLKGEILARMGEILDLMRENEVAIFLFEIGDFSNVNKSANLAKSRGCRLLNSLRFNEVDWTIVVKKEALKAQDLELAPSQNAQDSQNITDSQNIADSQNITDSQSAQDSQNIADSQSAQKGEPK